MSKKPSDATLLRAERRENKELRHMFEGYKKDAIAFRARATQAEQAVAEWKDRFDMLLKRLPSDASVSQEGK